MCWKYLQQVVAGITYGGPGGRAMRRCQCDDVDVMVDDRDVTVDYRDVTMLM